MNFASNEFLLLFLPTTLLLFAILRSNDRRLVLLIVMSSAFYAWSGAFNFMILLLSLATNYAAARTILSDRLPHLKKTIFLVGVSANVACLFAFKWLALISGDGDGFRTETSILIPLALSYITFQQVGFLYSVYRGTTTELAGKHYLFFIFFFPQLLIGPIVRFQDINNQLAAQRLARNKVEDLAVGFSIFGFGLCKKVLLADRLAPSINEAFAAMAAGSATTADMWFGIVGFQLQLFLDFSAYADMAIGLARMFGINLPLNFDRPLLARDRFDLWRRWHITFAMFMRTHVFIPLVRRAKLTPALALFVTALLSGIWHGLGWTFILWGFLQAVLMLLTHYRKRLFPPRRNSGIARIAASIAVTFFITCLMGIIFRMPTLGGLTEVGALLLQWVPGSELISPRRMLLFCICAFVAFVWPDTHRLFYRYWEAIDMRPAGNRPPGVGTRSWIAFDLNLFWAFSSAILLTVCLFTMSNNARFIYIQF